MNPSEGDCVIDSVLETSAIESNPVEEKDDDTLSTDDAYSVFTKAQKRWIIFLIAYAGMFSPLSSFIYYSAISAIARDLHSTVGLINVTITSYMIVSGVVPSLLSDIGDTPGRRPIYILAFVIYFAANIGLALQRNYVALVILRMLQSAGSSGRARHSLR